MSTNTKSLYKDKYSNTGHLDLVVRQARELGLSEEELCAAEPLPITTSATHAWLWIAYHRLWQASLAATSSQEFENDNRLLADLGGGKSARLVKTWERDLGFRPEQMPNLVAHSKADEKHSEMFLEIFERYVPAYMEDTVLRTAKESHDIYQIFYGGLATALERLP